VTQHLSVPPLAPAASAPAPSRRRSILTRGLRRPEFGALLGTLAVYGFFTITAFQAHFISLDGTASWLNSAAELGLIALPVALLLIAGEFDLSIGSMVGTSSMIVAVASATYGLNQWIGVALALAYAVLVGYFNGLLTTRTQLPSFIVTLSTLFVTGGAALGLSRLLAGTTAISMTPEAGPHALFASSLGQLQVTTAWWVAMTALAGWILTRTRFGNWIFATGGAPEVAREAGVPTVQVKRVLFVGTSIGSALVGIMQAMAFNGGDVTRGRSFIFDAVVAAVIGGILLQGGYGSAVGVSFGVATYGIVSVGIFYTGWNTDYAQLILGLLLVGAVLTNNYFRRLALSSG
jgi:simple sugar transport system permease protein